MSTTAAVPSRNGRQTNATRARTSRVAVIIALVAVLGAAAIVWERTNHTVGYDLYQFWIGSQAIARTDIANFYDREITPWIVQSYAAEAQREEPTELRTEAAALPQTFYSTPALYAFFALFPASSYRTTYYAYVALLLACVITGFVLLARTCSLPVPAALWLAAFWLALSEPVQSEFAVLNVNSLQFFGIATFLFVRSLDRRWSRFAAGAILGGVILFKPNVGLVAPFSLALLLASREFRAMIEETAGYIAGGAAVFGVSVAHSGADKWRLWWTAFRNMPPDVISPRLGNISPRQTFDGLVPHGGLVLGVLLLGLTLVLAIRAVRATGGATERFYIESLTCALALVLMFYVAPPMWIHYGMLAVPLLLWLVAAPAGRGKVVARSAGVVSLVLLAYRPLSPILGEGVRARPAVMNLALLISVAAALWVLNASGRRPGSPTAHSARRSAGGAL